MPFLVSKLVFTGLILFDMRHANRLSPRPLSSEIYLLQHQFTVPSEYYDGVIIPKHRAYIRYLDDDDTGYSTPPDMTAMIGQQLFRYYFLDGDEVAYNNPPPNDPLVVNSPEAPCSRNSHYFDVLHLKNEACSKCGDLAPKLMDLPSTAAHLRLASGCMGTTDDGRDHSWCLEPGDIKCGPLPQAVLVELNTATPYLYFTLTGRRPRTLIITANASPIYFEVASVDDIPLPVNKHEFADHHFEIYYDLFGAGNTIPPNPPVPYRFSNVSNVSGELLLTSGSNCPPTQWP
jgi:hypothetical protein